jgi:hypothetical protein
MPNVWFQTPIATLQIRVWDNRGGTIADWATAIAQSPGSELVGLSGAINFGNIGGVFIV